MQYVPQYKMEVSSRVRYRGEKTDTHRQSLPKQSLSKSRDIQHTTQTRMQALPTFLTEFLANRKWISCQWCPWLWCSEWVESKKHICDLENKIKSNHNAHDLSTLDTKHCFTKPLHKTVYIGMKNDYCLVCHITCCIRTWPEFLILNNSHNLLH